MKPLIFHEDYCQAESNFELAFAVPDSFGSASIARVSLTDNSLGTNANHGSVDDSVSKISKGL